MFDKYLIVENSLRNFGPPGAPTGFAFEARLGYYRGLGLSMVEDLIVTIDDEKANRGDIRFSVDGQTLSLEQMEQALDIRWEFGAVASISVNRAGGLASGVHKLALQEVLRISYLPFPLIAADAKDLIVVA